MILVSLLLTIFIYAVAKYIYRQKSLLVLSPLLICPGLLIAWLSTMNVAYETYHEGTQWLTTMLQPATVAFAIPLYKNRQLIAKHLLAITAGVLGGSVVALASSVAFAKWLHIDNVQLIDSLAPRSITTPIAMNVSETLGGMPTMTAVFVILTALTGLVVGPLVLRFLPLRHQVSRGMMFGMGAHAAGASKAYELGSLEGAIASLTMIFAGIVTILVAPVIMPVILAV